MTVRLLKGDDGTILGDAVRRVVAALVGDGDRGLIVEELAGEEYDTAAVADAAQTPPFLSDRRVVVARGANRFTADDLGPVLSYLADPLETTDLVLEWVGGRIPKALLDAVAKAGGEVEDASAPTGRNRADWLDGQARGAGVTLDAAARRLVLDRLGDDVSRSAGLLATLVAVYGEGVKLGAADVEPFLGEAGSVPPWELTDAIDRGDTAGALDRLHRIIGAGERHPLQVMGTLTAHYARILRLDGADAPDEKAAAGLLGLKGSTFPAKKALTQARRLGHDGVHRAMALLAEADLDLRGQKAWPDELVLEVLVARLSRLGGGRRATPSRSGSA
jgi:DNA polymerase-3 subunit delta